MPCPNDCKQLEKYRNDNNDDTSAILKITVYQHGKDKKTCSSSTNMHVERDMQLVKNRMNSVTAI